MELFATSLSESFREEASPRNTRCQCAVCYTDFWASYEKVIPKKRHQAVGKESGKTNHIERFNNIMRQRVSRLVSNTVQLVMNDEFEGAGSLTPGLLFVFLLRTVSTVYLN